MPTLMIVILGSLLLAPSAAVLALACAAAAGRADRRAGPRGLRRR
jgi:hypothetical protein